VIPPAIGAAPPRMPGAHDPTPLLEGGGGDAGGLRCRLCGLDEVPWPRTAYCSERCRRRAAYLARTQRRRGPGRGDGQARAARRTRRTRRTTP
jgi:hypothetical protein